MQKNMLEIDELVVETTRRCNMACPHCLRGPAMAGDMPVQTIRSILEQARVIDTVTFSGGEPSLAIPVMEAFYRKAKRLGVPVNSFFIATNGKENQEELALFALRQYAEAENKDLCAVSLSIDPYHEPCASDLIRGLACYSETKERDPSQLDWEVRAGNAEENGLGKPRKTRTEFTAYAPQSGGAVRTELVYLSANGFAYPECDLSYEEMDAVLNDPDDCPTEQFLVSELSDGLYKKYSG